MTDILYWLLSAWPSVFGGNLLRKIVYSRFWDHSDFLIPNNVEISGINKISIGLGFRVCPNVKLFATGSGLI